MHASMSGKTLKKACAATVLAFALAATNTPLAYAEPASDAEAAYQELTSLNQTAELSSYDVISIAAQLDDTNRRIDELNQQIQQSSVDLEAARKELSIFVAEDYKQGNMSLLDMIMGSSTFDEFISRVMYANKIVEHQRSAIERVDTLGDQLIQQKYDLEQSKTELERMLDEQNQRVEAANQASIAAEDYFQQLPQDVQEQVVALEEAVRNEDAEASMQILSQLEEAAAQADASAAVGDGGSATYTAASAVTSTTTSSSSYADMLARARSLIGSSYSYSGYNWTGSTSDSSFTCSGVVDYALGRSSQSSSPETLYEEVGSNLTTDVSSLKEGDLVFYAYGDREVGHVGVYIGDGYIIDSIPDGGVAVRDVNYMDVVGGGSLG